MNNNLENLENNIGYNFINKNLLINSITHSTYKYENNIKYDNQRLEYLGDAVWGLILADYLYRNNPHLPEGHLTKLRSLYAREEALFNISLKIKLDQFLLLGKGEVNDNKPLNKSILADSFEALIGAAWLDSGIDGPYAIFNNLIENSLLEINNVIIDDNPKGDLQEYTQQNHISVPIYELITKDGEVHSPTFTIKLKVLDNEFIGIGSSKKEAEKNAAINAMNYLKNDFKT